MDLLYIGLIVALAVVLLTGLFYVRRSARRAVSQARREAEKILNEAQRESEARLREAGLAAKEKLLQASVDGGGAATTEAFTVGIEGAEARVEVSELPASNVGALRRAGDHMRDKLGSGIVVLGSVIDERP